MKYSPKMINTQRKAFNAGIHARRNGLLIQDYPRLSLDYVGSFNDGWALENQMILSKIDDSKFLTVGYEHIDLVREEIEKQDASYAKTSRIQLTKNAAKCVQDVADKYGLKFHEVINFAVEHMNHAVTKGVG